MSPTAESTFRSFHAPLAALLLVLLPGCSGDGGSPERSGAEGAVGDGPPPSISEGGIVAETKSHDFGTVFPDTLNEKVFSFEVAEGPPLVITELRHSCDCTEGKLYVLDASGERGPVAFGEAYASGSRFELDATLNTAGKVGPQSQALHVMLEGIGRIETFTLEADIETYLVAEPPVVMAEGVSPFDGLTESIELRARQGGRFSVGVDKRFLCDDVELELTPRDPGDDGRAEVWTMAYRLRPKQSDVVDKCRVILRTDVPNENAFVPPGGDPDESAFHRFEYRTQVQVDPVLKAWPSDLDFSRVMPSWPATRRFTIRSIDADFELPEPTVELLHESRDEPYADAGAVQVTTSKSEEGDWEVELRIEELSRPGPFKFRVFVELGHPLQESLTVRVRGFAAS